MAKGGRVKSSEPPHQMSSELQRWGAALDWLGPDECSFVLVQIDLSCGIGKSIGLYNEKESCRTIVM